VRHAVTGADGKIEMVRDLSAFRWGFLAAAIAMALGTISFSSSKTNMLLLLTVNQLVVR
jgi:POT family proton-dependent oligopeptide transporter